MLQNSIRAARETRLGHGIPERLWRPAALTPHRHECFELAVEARRVPGREEAGVHVVGEVLRETPGVGEEAGRAGVEGLHGREADGLHGRSRNARVRGSKGQRHFLPADELPRAVQAGARPVALFEHLRFRPRPEEGERHTGRAALQRVHQEPIFDLTQSILNS